MTIICYIAEVSNTIFVMLQRSTCRIAIIIECSTSCSTSVNITPLDEFYNILNVLLQVERSSFNFKKYT